MTKPILLPVPKAMTWAAMYRRLASAADIHAQSQRLDAEQTEQVARAAFDRIALEPGQSVLDIGCGDGRLIARLSHIAGVADGTGLTEEERSRLASAYSGLGIGFVSGRFEDLDFSGVKFDVVILCGVINHLASMKEVRRALTISRGFAKAGARLYVAELRDMPSAPKRHRSTLRALRWVWRTSGGAATLGFALHLWKRRHRAGWYEVPRLPQFASDPDSFVDVARECGLDLIERWSTTRLNSDGAPHVRNDFMFRVRT